VALVVIGAVDFGAMDFGAPASSDGVALGATLAVAGRIRRGIGPHAVSAGTSSNVASATSHTKCRAPADARCIESVMPIATSSMSVALTSSISMVFAFATPLTACGGWLILPCMRCGRLRFNPIELDCSDIAQQEYGRFGMRPCRFRDCYDNSGVALRGLQLAPSFRGGAKRRTRNLEIPGLVLRTIPE